jgi:hypothetical protein
MSKDMLVKVEAQYPISGGAPILVSGGGGDRARTRREKAGRFVGGLAGGLGAIAGKHRSLGSLLQSIVSGYAQGKDLGGSAGKFFGGVSPEAQIRAQQREANRMAQAKKVAVERYGGFNKEGEFVPKVAVEDRKYDPYEFRPVMRNLRRGKGIAVEGARRGKDIAVEGARRAGEGLSHGLDYLEGSTDAQRHAEEFDRRAQNDPYAISVRQADERRQRVNRDLKDALRGVDDLLYESRGAPKVGIRGATPVRLPDYTRQLRDIDPSALNIYSPALASRNIDRGVDTTNVLVDSERAAALNANKQTMANDGAEAAAVPATPMTVLPPANGEGAENAADVQMGQQVIAQTGLDDDPDLAGTNPADGVTPMPPAGGAPAVTSPRPHPTKPGHVEFFGDMFDEDEGSGQKDPTGQVNEAFKAGQLALSEDRLPVVGIRKARRGILVV